MNNQEFRRYGHEVVDWIANYLENIRQYPVVPDIKPGDLMDRLPPAAPERGESMDSILQDFERLIVPAVTHWNHPRFLAYAGHFARRSRQKRRRRSDDHLKP